MSKLSLETCKRLHRELWFWLENRPDEQKDDWPGWDDDHMGHWRGEFINGYCFPCYYAVSVNSGFIRTCDVCPIKWPGDGCGDMELRQSDEWAPGVFNRWTDASGNQRKRLARAIRLMPWKDEVKAK